MVRTKLPDVILIDLDPEASVAAAVEQCVGSCCRLLREKDLTASGVPETHDVAAAIICASTIDAARVRAIVEKLSELGGLPVLLVTAAEESGLISRLLSSGVGDYVTWPVLQWGIVPRLERLLGSLPRSDTFVAPLANHHVLAQLVGVSRAFRALIHEMKLAAASDATIFIHGETGTGKGVCARAIHDLSVRSGKSFVAMNCGAIPLELIENELFGHERGAFTDATRTRQGLVYEAEGGTLFLDEVDSLPPNAQVKLLRLLQEQEYRSLGSTKVQSADIRVVAATNVDTTDAMRSGRLREDFYFRLSVLPLTIPPLRERGEDIVPLARHFLRTEASELKRPVATLSTGAATKLLAYDWPGNVRELENSIKRAVVVAENPTVLTAGDILLGGKESPFEGSFAEAKTRALDRFERGYVQGLLATHAGNLRQAALAARTNRHALRRLMEKHGFDAKDFRGTSP